ncbi:hypothetical protein SLS61_002450 [Didymella pomorum]
MVGVINPNSTQTLASQIQAAKNADFQLAVGDPVPNEATSTILNGPTGSSTPSSSGGGTHLSGGAIAGIVVGAVAFLVICAALFFYVGRSKSLKEVIKRQDANTGNPNRASTPGPDMGYMPHDQNVPRYGSPAPPYGQHNVGEQYPSGWQGSPQMHQGHLSMQSHMSGMSQEQYVNSLSEIPGADKLINTGSIITSIVRLSRRQSSCTRPSRDSRSSGLNWRIIMVRRHRGLENDPHGKPTRSYQTRRL